MNIDLLRFGPFEADLRTGELRKYGIRIKLTRQAFQVLTALADRPGELLLRDDLRRILWPNETVVDFDQSINTAVKRIRDALNDSPEEKRYLETLPKRGYRFVAEVQRLSYPVGAAGAPSPVPIPVPESDPGPAVVVDWDSLAGQLITHYRVLELIGRGGMGVVYRAEDIRLGRQVALKLLALELDEDPLAAQRFEHEARTASTLNHTNICIVYEADVHAGRPFIAMELLEGETLGERMANPVNRSRPSIRFLIDLATQVGDALETAHERGVIHRDIKPSNIFLTRRGEVKVLDFGLAKTSALPHTDGFHGVRRVGDFESNEFTVMGAIPGTPMYMSPEQAEGAELDGRSDLYSLGLVLYEAATGERPAVGIRTSLLAASGAAEYPTKFWDILERLLEPERELRYQSARDVVSEFRRLRRELSSSQSNPSVPTSAQPISVLPNLETAEITGSTSKSKSKASLGWAAAAFLGLLIAVVARKAVLPLTSGAAHPSFETRPFDSLPGLEDDLAFAPSATQAAFMWNGGAGDDYHLYVKLLGIGAPVALTNHKGIDFSPAWAPDGRFIAAAHFTSPSTADTFVVPALGGTERHIASLHVAAPDQDSRILTWSPDGKSLFASDRLANSGPSSIVSIPLDGGAKKQITWPPTGMVGDSDPEVSPDGRMLAYIRWSRDSVSEIYLQPLNGGPSRELTNDGKRIAGIAWSEDGKDIIFSSTRGALPGLWKVASSGGSPEPLAGASEDAVAPAVARRSNLLAYTHQAETVNIWRTPGPQASASGERHPTQLITSARQQISGTYSPDGTRIAFASDRSGSFEIWMADSDGTHARQLTSFGGPITGTPHWSHDGSWIAFDSRPGGHSAVFVINVESGQQRQITRGDFDDIVPSWSRDDQFLYFCSSRTGSEEIWRSSVNGANLRQVTKNGGFESEESEDGQWLYYSRRGGTLWRMPVAGGAQQLVLNELLGRYWTLTRNGVYFLRSAQPHPKIQVLDFGTGHILTVGELTGEVDWGYSGLSVSPDERWVIYAQMDDLVNRIMQISNFK